jgi:hypothetical protein
MLDSLVGRRFAIRTPTDAFQRDFRVVAVAGTIASIVDVDEVERSVRVYLLLRAMHDKTVAFLS